MNDELGKLEECMNEVTNDELRWRQSDIDDVRMTVAELYLNDGHKEMFRTLPQVRDYLLNMLDLSALQYMETGSRTSLNSYLHYLDFLNMLDCLPTAMWFWQPGIDA